jgi:hypothetical protein
MLKFQPILQATYISSFYYYITTQIYFREISLHFIYMWLTFLAMKIIDVYIFKKNQFITSTSLKFSLKKQSIWYFIRFGWWNVEQRSNHTISQIVTSNCIKFVLFQSIFKRCYWCSLQIYFISVARRALMKLWYFRVLYNLLYFSASVG